jgi:hypothetical protein
MEIKEVKRRLCLYDERNPDRPEGLNTKYRECYCDNCFYGRAEMAEEILSLIEAERKAFEAGNQMIWEDLEQTSRIPKFDSFEEYKNYQNENA